MKKVVGLLMVLMILLGNTAMAQLYDIVIKGGHVIDDRLHSDRLKNTWPNR